ncbi:MAG: hypothetical protein RLN88_04150 [Ekhidna sp.]|uniref:hypothetical protein n=1 Tax=Ekhidna sp. TaxID=2608089 RepID=UPI0032ED7E4F
MNNLKHHIEQMDQLVMAVTGLEQEHLAKVKFDFAYEYLEHVIGTDTYGLQELPKTAIFWGHWLKVWYQIDVELFEGSEEVAPVFLVHEGTGHWLQRTSIGNCVVHDMISAYLQYHEATRLGWQMNSAILEEGWHQTIKELANKSKTIIKRL